MPWHIVPNHSGCPASKPYAVVKDSDSSVAGCHPSRDHATKQLRALYANESSSGSSERFEQGELKPGATFPPSADAGGDQVTSVQDHDTDVEEFGGKPKPGTPPDKRLKRNRSMEVDDVTAATSEDTETQATADEASSTVQWQGVLVPEGNPTGDGREFAIDSVRWVDPPMPLRWQKEGAHGGENDRTVQVGLITRVWRDENNRIMGEGHFDLGGPDNDDAHEAFRRMGAGTAGGISIDADDITDADVEYVFPDNKGETTEDDDVLFMLFQRPEKVIFHSARIRAATLCDIPAFIDAKIHLLSDDERAAMVASPVIEQEQDLQPSDFRSDALVAHAWHDEWRPPADWFADPSLGQVMPIMVTEQGRIYGHAAQWGQCHLGYMGECVMPPFEDEHSYYRTGEVICEDGSHVAVGAITAGIEHARLSAGPSAAKQHYENTDAVVGFVVTGNDKHGIWVAGAIRPDAHPARVQALRGSGQVSPDWRRIGGALRMVGLLTVNVSGYQVPKAKAHSLVAGGQIQSLIVEGMVSVHTPQVSEADLDRRAMLLLRQKLSARVNGEG
jgi:hypothetical protein